MFLSVAGTAVNLISLILNPADADVWLSVGMSVLRSGINVYLTFLAIGGITLLTEWKKIHAPAHKKLLHLFTFPIFMLTYVPISVAALFIRVEWKPIVHSKSRSLAEIKRGF